MRHLSLTFALVCGALVASGQSTVNGIPATIGGITPTAVIGTPLAVPTAPTVTSTPNTNLLSYTGQIAAEWNLANTTATGGQPDENSAATATLAIPTTSGAPHHVYWNPYVGGFSSSQAVVASVYVKPSGYTTVLFGITSANSGNGNDATFNASTCAVTTQPTNGSTATATTAGNGYCLLSLAYTIAAGAYIQNFYVTSTGYSTATFPGNGTSGIYISHPQFTLGSSAQSYQDVTGTHRYAVACYTAGGVTSGVGQWATSLAEQNVVTPACPSGFSYAKVFRTGGYTQGALTVSGSTQLTPGTAVTDNSLVADGTTPPTSNGTALVAANFATGTGSASSASLPGADTRPTQYQITEYAPIGWNNYSPMNYPYRVFTGEPGMAGTITSIHISGGDPLNMSLRFTCDGLSQTVSYGMFFKSQDLPAAFSTGRFVQVPSGTGFGGYTATIEGLEINFASGCNIDIINNSYYDQTGFVDVGYKVGRYVSKPTRTHWHAVQTTAASVASQMSLNLLGTTSYPGGGEVESETLFFQNATGFQFLEGNPTIITDGSLAVTANGGEDFFRTGFYGLTNSYASNTNGFFTGSALTARAALNDVLAYRYWGSTALNDSLLFNSTLQATVSNGQINEGSVSSVAVTALLTFWTVN